MVSKKTQLEKYFKIAFAAVMARKFATDGKILLNQFPLMSNSVIGKFNDPDIGPVVYVAASDKHIAYLRKWVNPKDPQTSKQLKHRSHVKLVNQHWHQETESTRQAWNKAAPKAGQYTGQNYYFSRWFKVLKEKGNPPGIGFLP